MFRETIYALSSGALPSGVAVIRLSGPHCAAIVRCLAGKLPPPRHAALRTLEDEHGAVLDRGLVVHFPAPHSFTGEDGAELHLHGGRAVVMAMLDWLGSQDGLRQAEAGEFTRRAFINGKLDLTAAEGLADLIEAETEAQRVLALANAAGGQKNLYDGWRSRLIHARAMIEAELDFADESDVPGSVADAVWKDVARMVEEIVNHIDGFRAAEIVREGYRVVLVGAPNAGKSSLINALARREVTIVTDVPGTTRDLVDVSLDLRGQKVVVTDTAGLRETRDRVEAIGVERAREAAARADLVVELVAADGDGTGVEPVLKAARLRVLTKSDLGFNPMMPDAFDLAVSSRSGDGLDVLTRMIAERAHAAAGRRSAVAPTRLRQVELLKTCVAHLGHASTGGRAMLELRAEELRLAADALGKITGAVDVEDLLDVIFSSFCIGK